MTPIAAITLKEFILSRLYHGEIKEGQTSAADAKVEELLELARETRLRELAFWSCANLVGNWLSRCEIKTFVWGREKRGPEYYMWNVEPNQNQSAVVFWIKFVSKLYSDNEALVISIRAKDGEEGMHVADSWAHKKEYVQYANSYNGVCINDFSFDQTFYENELLHFRLNHKKMKPVIDSLYSSYYRLIAASMKSFEWDSGRHMKVHIDSVRDETEGFAETFQRAVDGQMRPFMEAGSAVLPEFDGWEYSDLSKNYTTQKTTRDIRALYDDILDFTARGFLLPPGIFTTTADGKKEAVTEALTNAMDPLCAQIGQEITRKRYGYKGWKAGHYVKVDSSSVRHFDPFDNAVNTEKLISSGGYSINDVRRMGGQTEIDEPWANVHFITKNFELITRVLKALEGGE